jgi:acetylglutamate kinase
MASSLAIAMSGEYYTKLVYCFEKEGVLQNTDDESSVIPLITTSSYKALKDKGVIKDGMLPKMDNAFYALENSVSEVYIKNAANLNNHKGTLLKK